MIPVCVPTLGEEETENVADCVERSWISARGDYVTEFEDRFADYCNREYGISTTSGTTALHLALEAIGVDEGDEVIIPTLTNAACAFAVRYCGADPVLVDIDPETWCMDPQDVEAAISGRTAAIMPVHLYGHPVDMDPILELALEHDIRVIEDAAEAHGAEYRGQRAGNIGDIGCFSFYANKLITTGEGGMVVTDDETVAKRAEHLKDLAYSESDRYVHDAVGFNYRMTNLQAAVGVAQVEKLDRFVEMRRENARKYNERLAAVNGIRTPPEKEWARSNYWMYAVTVEDSFPVNREGLIERLSEREIGTRRFFVPMHQQPVFNREGRFEDERYPASETAGRRGLYLPSTSHLSTEEINEVCDAIESIARV
jgi:perosamine synthetase